MKLKDQRGSEFALSATGEGVVSEMVAETSPSYKDLPVVIHQFIIKLRDEIRTRGGLLRTREFVMKDAYSFHATEEDMLKTYNDFAKAYENCCNRLDLKYYSCIADSGALGGDYCHEYQIPCDAGEDKIVRCKKCDYAANVEKAEFIRKKVNSDEEIKDYEEVKLPLEVATMKQLVKHYNMPAERFIKNVVYKTSAGKLIIATITGDLDVNAVKLAKAVGEDELELATEEDLESIGSQHGFVHSWGYDDHRDKIIFVVDEVIPEARNLYGGYKTETTDPINVNYPRDFQADIVADIAEPYNGAECKKCGGELELIRAIEFGHIFKYDHFYSEHHDAYFVDQDGEKKLMYMGAYGIGIGRAIATVVETHHDDKGIIWPESIAPFKVHLISLAKSNNDEAYKQAESLYRKLLEASVEVLWDDRLETSPGQKFADADLIGNPYRVVVSAKSLEAGGIELKMRDSDKTEIVTLEAAVEKLCA
ncbi:proline--tRNA ligase, partial [Candidatus Nomurabacteria bacterium]|nr:proline--tRNA ligase [Candidatus Nomurabacteria bacterium]